MLARKVVTRRGRHIRGYFPSTKLRRMVAWESMLERDAVLLLEMSPGIVRYQEQPARIVYADGLRTREYFPDFELTLEDGQLVHLEIKESSELAKPSIAAKYGSIAAHYRREARSFRIATELEIRREPLFGNLKRLASLHAHPWHERPTAGQLRQLFRDHSVTFAACEAKFGYATTLRLIAAGTVLCNLDLPLTADALLQLPQGGCNATILL
ncbi:hypothetical protein HNQ50_003035 [Silvimonas terrae]|uniref:TnsA endonuclease N-terminal domain-containing protein n=1 Tax=Silvimonas terrae TaxID=300266 RepID=A0A840RI86_9NEIS|nr:TnsA endonuclease N-terminal domain-containing protein [Silvimonas terrae]MBB5192294.1 hypothetical protein [Silvimonas terrae]